MSVLTGYVIESIYILQLHNGHDEAEDADPLFEIL